MMPFVRSDTFVVCCCGGKPISHIEGEHFSVLMFDLACFTFIAHSKLSREGPGEDSGEKGAEEMVTGNCWHV